MGLFKDLFDGGRGSEARQVASPTDERLAGLSNRELAEELVRVYSERREGRLKNQDVGIAEYARQYLDDAIAIAEASDSEWQEPTANTTCPEGVGQTHWDQVAGRSIGRLIEVLGRMSKDVEGGFQHSAGEKGFIQAVESEIVQLADQIPQ